VPLEFPPKWRFTPPKFGEDEDEPGISSKAVSDFETLIKKIGSQGNPWDTLEHFKTYFARASSSTASRSSSEEWAETDLWHLMMGASENAPLFIEAFHDGCTSLERKGLGVPDVGLINEILRKRRIPLELDPPHLRLRDGGAASSVEPPQVPPTLAENAKVLLDKSVARSHELLEEGRGTEAVREMLWLLESLVTGFKGVEVAGKEIKGKYFNEIAAELRRANKDTLLEQALRWTEQLHGYLSSPTGGAVRHGIDLAKGRPLATADAKLFVNLILSYLSYILSEHERLSTTVGS
jgi:hypothetical protein